MFSLVGIWDLQVWQKLISSPRFKLHRTYRTKDEGRRTQDNMYTEHGLMTQDTFYTGGRTNVPINTRQRIRDKGHMEQNTRHSSNCPKNKWHRTSEKGYRHRICHACMDIIRVKYFVFWGKFLLWTYARLPKKCIVAFSRSFSYTFQCPQAYHW